MTPPAVTDALAAARLSADTRCQVDRAWTEQLTLDQYAILAEFQNDPDAISRLLAAWPRWGASLEHEAERLRQQRAEHAEHERLRGGAGRQPDTRSPAILPARRAAPGRAAQPRR